MNPEPYQTPSVTKVPGKRPIAPLLATILAVQPFLTFADTGDAQPPVPVPLPMASAGPGPIQHEVEGSEYHASWQADTGLADVEAAWQAANPVHGFQTYFSDNGVLVTPREKEVTSWQWGLTLLGHGRGGHVVPAETPSVGAHENRIDYVRGDLREWYVNDTRGSSRGSR